MERTARREFRCSQALLQTVDKLGVMDLKAETMRWIRAL